MQILKRSFSLIVWVSLIGFGFLTSCSEDDNDDNSVSGGSLTIKIPDNLLNNYGISNIKVFGGWKFAHNEDDPYDVFITEATYKKGTNIVLPNNLNDDILFGITDLYPYTVQISDEKAKVIEVGYFSAFDKEGEERGTLGLEYEDSDYDYIQLWIYSDRKVNITGTDNKDNLRKPRVMNLNLKKGWNVVYQLYSTQNVTITTRKPTGINMEWWFNF